MLRHGVGVDLLGQLTSFTLSASLSQPGAEQATRSRDARIRQIRFITGRADRYGQQRLLPDNRSDTSEGPNDARHLRRFELKGIGVREAALAPRLYYGGQRSTRKFGRGERRPAALGSIDEKLGSNQNLVYVGDF